MKIHILKKYWYNKIIVILLVTNITLFSNCEKIQYKKVYIKGVFWDYCGEQPLPNFTIRIIEGNSRNYKEELITETKTDANGNFDFGEMSIRKKLMIYYRIYAVYNSDKDMLTSGVGDVEPYNIKNTNGLYINMHNKEKVLEDAVFGDTIRACGYIQTKIFFSPPPPYNIEDSINITITGKYGNVITENWHYLNFIKENGEAIMGKGNTGLYNVKVYKKRNNIVTEYEDLWKIKWKENATYTVNFN